MTDAPWINMTDWSGLPDVYVTKAECQSGMFWRIEACSVPMAIGPEVRLVRADLHAAALDEVAKLRSRVVRLQDALAPFAEAAEEADDYGFDDMNQAPVDCGVCREARAALGDSQ